MTNFVSGRGGGGLGWGMAELAQIIEHAVLPATELRGAPAVSHPHPPSTAAPDFHMARQVCRSIAANIARVLQGPAGSAPEVVAALASDGHLPLGGFRGSAVQTHAQVRCRL